MSNQLKSRNAILKAQAVVPDDIVFQEFATETVVLNLQTGKYHGLNPTGGRMLAALQASPTVRDAAERLGSEYDQRPEQIESDLCEFCFELERRGLVQLINTAR